MKDLEVETRLDVIARAIAGVHQPCEPLALSRHIEAELAEWELYHAQKRWMKTVSD